MKKEEKKDIKETIDILKQLSEFGLILAKNSIETIHAMELIQNKNVG